MTPTTTPYRDNRPPISPLPRPTPVPGRSPYPGPARPLWTVLDAETVPMRPYRPTPTPIEPPRPHRRSRRRALLIGAVITAAGLAIAPAALWLEYLALSAYILGSHR